MKLALATLLLTGCVDLRPVRMSTMQATPADCDAIDRAHMGWTASATALGILGGSSGVTALLTDNTPRYVVGGVGITLTAGAAVSTYLSTAYAQKFVRDCTKETP